MKIKKILLVVISIFLLIIFIPYVIFVLSHTFFYTQELNIFLSTKLVFAQLYAFPVFIGSVMSVIFLIPLVILICILRKKFYKNTIVIILSILLFVSIIFIFASSPTTKKTSSAKSGKEIKIVTWNALETINEKNVDEIFSKFDADIAIFPELEGLKKGDRKNERIKVFFDKNNIDFNKYDTFISSPKYYQTAPVTAVVKKSFGNYFLNEENRESTTFGTVYLKSNDENLPEIIGIHTSPPIPGDMYKWKGDIELISKITKENKNAIVLGDFNATMRHGSLSNIKSYEDVLEYLPKLKRGTWRSNFISPFKTSIDHILIPKNQYEVKNVEIKYLDSSDHMAVFTTLHKKSG